MDVALQIGGYISLVISAVAWITLKSFFKKKGENLATKTDMQELTRLQGEIKHELALVKESKISFQALRREAVINFYEKYVGWYNYLLSLDFENANYAVIHNRFELLEMEYYNAESRLRLFIDDFTVYEDLIHSLTYTNKVIQINYVLYLEHYLKMKGSYNSDEGKDLIRDKMKTYSDFKFKEVQKATPNLKELSAKFRAIISSTIAES